MTPQELRNSILQLAIQGKLVEQGKNDSSVDLAGIKPKETDDYEFELPENWELAHLESITNGIPSKQYQILESEVQGAGNYPVISQSKAYSIGFTDKSEKVFHHDRPVVIFGDHTAEVKYVKFDFVVGADGVKIFEPIYEILTAEFLFYVLQFYSKDLSKVGGYSRHYKFIKNKPIPIPPLTDQRRIVAKIEELLPYIDHYEQAWSRLDDFNKRFPDDMKKSILQLAIQGKLVEQRPEEGTAEELYQQIQAEKQRLIRAGKIKKEKPLSEITEDEMPFEIPESWMWVRWGALSESIQYGYNAPAKTSGRIKMVRISDIQNGEVKWDTVPFCDIKEADISGYLLEKNDILFARTGGTVGKSYLVKDTSEDAIYAGYLIRTRYSSYLCPEYMKFFMESQLYWTQLKSGTIATAQPNCNGKTLSKMILPLPPLAEQKRIVAKLEELLLSCERLK